MVRMGGMLQMVDIVGSDSLLMVENAEMVHAVAVGWDMRGEAGFWEDDSTRTTVHGDSSRLKHFVDGRSEQVGIQIPEEEKNILFEEAGLTEEGFRLFGPSWDERSRKKGTGGIRIVKFDGLGKMWARMRVVEATKVVEGKQRTEDNKRGEQRRVDRDGKSRDI